MFVGMIACSSDDDTTTSLVPEAPILTSPQNNLLCTSNIVDFAWGKSEDLDGQVLSYQIQIATDTQFSTLITDQIVSETYATYSLEKGKAYYWRVKALDNDNNESDYSINWNFYTEADAIENHLPLMPSLIAPLLNTSMDNTSVLLEWSCSDPDNDSLTYDIYYGTSSDVSMIASGSSLDSYNLTNLNSGKHYWRIDAIDTHKNKTIGQLWSFSVELF